MKKTFLTAAAMLCTIAAQAVTVQRPASPIVIDGKLDEKAWTIAEKQGPFVRLASQKIKKIKGQTEFSVLADDEAMYLGITCYDDEMDKVLPSKNFWGSDTIEMFFSPMGNSSEFYQFAANLSEDDYAQYYAEGGNIRPDKYAPFWEHKATRGKDAWYLEVRLPYSAFYNTRNSSFSTTWLLNVARTQTHEGGTTTWSHLQNGFLESKGFNKVEGFPLRKDDEDIAIPVVTANMTSQANGMVIGDVTATLESGPKVNGIYSLTVSVPGGNSKCIEQLKLSEGTEKITVSGVEFPEEVKSLHRVRFELKKGEKVFGRCMPLSAKYEPLAVKITYPQYANNFYPGQKSDEIKGRIILKITEEEAKNAVVELSVGEQKMFYSVSKGRSMYCGGCCTSASKCRIAPVGQALFGVYIPAMKQGDSIEIQARLLVNGKEMRKAATTVQYPVVPKEVKNPVWIEDGHIVVAGKPFYPRHIYAFGYMGGKAMAKRFEDEKETIGMNNYRNIGLEAGRMCTHLKLETKEAMRDVKPCQEYLDAIKAVIEKNRGRDFVGYYICDEPECRSISPIYLKYTYDYIKKLDPFHPVVACTRSPQMYLDCCDVFMMHTYISPLYTEKGRILGTPIDKVREQMHEVRDYNMPDKVAGFTGQFFSYYPGNMFADYPTWDELIAQSWTAIANGSKVSFPYAYHDINDRMYMFDAFVYMNKSIEVLNDLLLSGNEKVMKVEAAKWLDATLFEANGIKLLIMGNPFPEAISATVSGSELSGDWYVFRDGAKVTMKSKNKVDFAPYQYYIYVTDAKLGADLPKTKDILAKNAKHEYELAHNGNLLYGKGLDFEYDASVTVGEGSLSKPRKKLFDGSKDMLAWGSNVWKTEQWLSIDFKKQSPAFARLRVYGYNLKNIELSTWQDGKWIAQSSAAITENQKDGYKEIILKEPCSTQKLKLSFKNLTTKKDLVQLYELEMYEK